MSSSFARSVSVVGLLSLGLQPGIASARDHVVAKGIVTYVASPKFDGLKIQDSLAEVMVSFVYPEGELVGWNYCYDEESDPDHQDPIEDCIDIQYRPDSADLSRISKSVISASYCDDSADSGEIDDACWYGYMMLADIQTRYEVVDDVTKYSSEVFLAVEEGSGYALELFFSEEVHVYPEFTCTSETDEIQGITSSTCVGMSELAFPKTSGTCAEWGSLDSTEQCQMWSTYCADNVELMLDGGQVILTAGAIYSGTIATPPNMVLAGVLGVSGLAVNVFSDDIIEWRKESSYDSCQSSSPEAREEMGETLADDGEVCPMEEEEGEDEGSGDEGSGSGGGSMTQEDISGVYGQGGVCTTDEDTLECTQSVSYTQPDGTIEITCTEWKAETCCYLDGSTECGMTVVD